MNNIGKVFLIWFLIRVDSAIFFKDSLQLFHLKVCRQFLWRGYTVITPQGERLIKGRKISCCAIRLK